MMRRRGAALAGSLILVVLLTGCERLRVDPVQQFRPAAAEATAGGRLVVGLEAPASIDPAKVADDSGRLISSLVCEPLIQLDPVTGGMRNGIVENAIVAGKGAAFTLALRDDVRFHNGARLTAQDVAYALSRVARHEIAAPAADVLAPVLGYGTLHAPPSPTDDADPADRVLAGVRPIGKNALELTLSERNAGFLRALSLPFAAPVPRRLPDRDANFGEQPICAGPYRLARPYRFGDSSIELRRFTDYYGSDEAYVGRGKGYADTIEFRLMPRTAQVAAYAAGRLDVAQVAPADLRRAQTLPGMVAKAAVPQVEFLGTTAASGPLADRRVRTVLSRALDRGQLVADVFDGGRQPADRLVPTAAAVSAVPAACAAAMPAGPKLPDTEGAALIAPLMRTGLQLTVNDDFDNVKVARAVAAQWRSRLGLRVTVRPQAWEAYRKALSAPGGIPGLFRTGWQAAYPAEDPVLVPLFSGRGIGADNVTRYRNRDLDRLLERQARQAADEAVRAAKYRAAEEQLCRDLPLIPLTFGQAEYLVRDDRVAAAGQGFVEVATGLPVLREIYIRRNP